MARRTELVKHIIPNTSSLCMEEEYGRFNSMIDTIREKLKPYHRIHTIHLERGQNLWIECWEDIWSSGL